MSNFRIAILVMGTNSHQQTTESDQIVICMAQFYEIFNLRFPDMTENAENVSRVFRRPPCLIERPRSSQEQILLQAT